MRTAKNQASGREALVATRVLPDQVMSDRPATPRRHLPGKRRHHARAIADDGDDPLLRPGSAKPCRRARKTFLDQPHVPQAFFAMSARDIAPIPVAPHCEPRRRTEVYEATRIRMGEKK